MLKPEKNIITRTSRRGITAMQLKFHYPTNPFLPASTWYDWLHNSSGRDQDKKSCKK